MGLVANKDTAGKERTRLCKVIVISLKELFKNPEPNDRSKDLTACIAMSLYNIHKGIDETVEAWEKRDYWIKSERFRRDWEWTYSSWSKLSKALKNEDWSTIAICVTDIAQRLENVTVSEKHRLGSPWEGAYEAFCRLNE